MCPVDNSAAAAAARQAALEAMRREQERQRAEAARQQQAAAQRAAAELGRKEAAAAKHPTGGMQDDVMRPGMARALQDEAALASQVERISPKEATAESAKLAEDLKAAKTPEDVQKLAERADVLRGRVEASHDASFAPKDREAIAALQDQATGMKLGLEQLATAERSLKEGTPGERTAAMAHLMAHPGELKGALKDLKGIDAVDKRVAALDAAASPDKLAEALSGSPGMSEYPAGLASDLGRLRDVDHGPLQHQLNRVASELVTTRPGGSADHPGATGLSYQQIKDDPALARLVGGLAKSPDAQVRAKFEATVQGWQAAALRQSMDDHAQKPGADGHPTADENTVAAFDQFKSEMQALGEHTGQPELVGKTMGAAARDAGEQLLASGLSLDQVKANPAYGQLIGPMAADPKYADQVQRLMTGWATESLNRNLAAGDKGEGPSVPTTGPDGKPLPEGAVNGAKSIQGYQAEMTAIAQATGLDPTRAMQDAAHGVATRIADGELSLDKAKKNGAYGQLLGTLQKDPAYGGKVDDKVKGWVNEAIDKNCEGKEGEDGAKAAQEGAIKDIQDVAAVTGLGGTDALQKDNLSKAFEDKGDKFKHIVDEGKSWFEKGVDWVGDRLGDVAKIAIDISPVGLAMKGLETLGVADGLTKQFEGFKDGVGDAVSGTVSGIGTMVAHPIKTVENLGMMVTHPSMIVEAGKAMWNEGMKGGIGHAFGYFGANLAMMIGTGGAGAAVKGFATGARAAELLNGVGQAGRLGSFAVKGAELAGKGVNLASKGVEIVGNTKLGQFAKVAGTKVGQVAEKGAALPGVKQAIAANAKVKNAFGELGERAGARVAGPRAAEAAATPSGLGSAARAATAPHAPEAPTGPAAPAAPGGPDVTMQVPGLHHAPPLVDRPGPAPRAPYQPSALAAHRGDLDARIAQARGTGLQGARTTPQNLPLIDPRREPVRVPSGSNPDGWQIAGRDLQGNVVVGKDGHGAKAVSPATLATENPRLLQHMQLPDGGVVMNVEGGAARVVREAPGGQVKFEQVPVAKLMSDHPDLVANHVRQTVDGLPFKEIRNGRPVNVDRHEPLRQDPNVARLPDLLGNDGRTVLNRDHTQRLAADRYNALSPDDKNRLWALHNSASTQAEQGALQRALATGADMRSLEAFSADMRRVATGGPAELKAMGLGDNAIAELGGHTPDQRVLRMTTLEGHQQFFTMSCNPTSFQIVRAEYDPMYAMTSNMHPQTLLDEQARLLRGANMQPDGTFRTPDGQVLPDVAYLRHDLVPPAPKRSLLDRLLGRNKPEYQVGAPGAGQGSHLQRMADQLNAMRHQTGVTYNEHWLPQETVQGPNGPFNRTTRAGRLDAVDRLDQMLIDGKPTEIGVTWRHPDGSPSGGGHAIAVVDRRVGPTGDVQFLLHDPQLSLGGRSSTSTQWVNATDLVDGRLGGSYGHFGTEGQLTSLLLG